MDSTLEAHPDGDVVLDLKGILTALARRWMVILAITGVVGLGTFMLASAIPPRFQAETKILIENREVNLATGQGQSAPDLGVIDQETVASQVQLLTSRDLARRVAEKQGLADRAEFDGGSAGSILDAVLISIGLGRDPMRVSPEERVIDAFMERLKVYRVEGSRVVVVEFTSKDRALAASVANSVAEEYMALQGEAKRLTSEDQTRWLGDEIARLRDKVRDAEASVEAFRSGSDLIVGANNTTIARQQITDVTNAIAAARSDKAAAESRAAELAALIDRRDALGEAADVVDTEAFRTLRSREIALRGRLSELSETLLPGHPQMRTVRSQIRDVVDQQVAEARRALSGLRNDARVADARIASLTRSLDDLKVASAANGESEVELRALEREAASQRNLLEGLLVRYREAIARQNAEVLPADARVISRAAVPVEPTFPKVLPMTLAATLAGLLLSIGWVVSVEFLTGRALVRATGVPDKPLALDNLAADTAPPAGDDGGRVARFRSAVGAARPAERGNSEQSLVNRDASLLHAALVAAGAARVSVVPAGDPAEVPPVVAELSRAATQEGTRIVVVDLAGGRGGPGLADLIRGEAAFGEIIHRNRSTRAHEIGAGGGLLDPELLAGDALETILGALENTYDLVVVLVGAGDGATGARAARAVGGHVALVGDPDEPRTGRAYQALMDAGCPDVLVVPPSVGRSDAAA